MSQSLTSWMIAGGPRRDEHDQRLSHILAIRESGDDRRTNLVDRIRTLMAPARRTEQLDCCVA